MTATTITNPFAVPMESPRLGITLGPGESVTVDDSGAVISADPATEPAPRKSAPKPTTKPKPADNEEN